MAYDNSKPFIALELYTKEKMNRLKPTSYEYQASAKTMLRDTHTKKKFAIYEFANWLKEPHVLQKIQSGGTLCVGSVDIQTESPDKFTGSSKERKFVFFFKDKSTYNQGVARQPATAQPSYGNAPIQEETVKAPAPPSSAVEQWANESDSMSEEVPF